MAKSLDALPLDVWTCIFEAIAQGDGAGRSLLALECTCKALQSHARSASQAVWKTAWLRDFGECSSDYQPLHGNWRADVSCRWKALESLEIRTAEFIATSYIPRSGRLYPYATISQETADTIGLVPDMTVHSGITLAIHCWRKLRLLQRNTPLLPALQAPLPIERLGCRHRPLPLLSSPQQITYVVSVDLRSLNLGYLTERTCGLQQLLLVSSTETSTLDDDIHGAITLFNVPHSRVTRASSSDWTANRAQVDALHSIGASMFFKHIQQPSGAIFFGLGSDPLSSLAQWGSVLAQWEGNALLGYAVSAMEAHTHRWTTAPQGLDYIIAITMTTLRAYCSCLQEHGWGFDMDPPADRVDALNLKIDKREYETLKQILLHRGVDVSPSLSDYPGTAIATTTHDFHSLL